MTAPNTTEERGRQEAAAAGPASSVPSLSKGGHQGSDSDPDKPFHLQMSEAQSGLSESWDLVGKESLGAEWVLFADTRWALVT